jgi:hypothetical protein
MGLNHVRMGHSDSSRRGRKNHAAFDSSIFFDISPDLLMVDCGDFGQPCFPAGPEYSQANLMLKGVLDDPGFEARYVPARIAGPEGAVAVYANRDRVPALEALGLRVLRPEERCGGARP